MVRVYLAGEAGPVTIGTGPPDQVTLDVTLIDTLGGVVDHVEVTTIDQITLVMRDQRQVLWGSAEESELKAQVVDRLLAAQKASYYDVSVPGNPTYRP